MNNRVLASVWFCVVPILVGYGIGDFITDAGNKQQYQGTEIQFSFNHNDAKYDWQSVDFEPYELMFVGEGTGIKVTQHCFYAENYNGMDFYMKDCGNIPASYAKKIHDDFYTENPAHVYNSTVVWEATIDGKPIGFTEKEADFIIENMPPLSYYDTDDEQNEKLDRIISLLEKLTGKDCDGFMVDGFCFKTKYYDTLDDSITNIQIVNSSIYTKINNTHWECIDC